jgi:HNH endonuclease
MGRPLIKPFPCKVCSKEFKPRAGRVNVYCSSKCYGESLKIPIKDRFWAKVSKGPHCWEWTANSIKAGYGTIKDNKRMLLAHRVSYELNIGPLELGKLVCHKCNNPKCVRPDHLYLGTQVDNMADRRKAGKY